MELGAYYKDVMSRCLDAELLKFDKTLHPLNAVRTIYMDILHPAKFCETLPSALPTEFDIKVAKFRIKPAAKPRALTLELKMHDSED